MKRLEIEASTDETGSIRIRLPGPPAKYDVKVIVEWNASAEDAPKSWPPGFLDRMFGAIDDPTFGRLEQGVVEPIPDFECCSSSRRTSAPRC